MTLENLFAAQTQITGGINQTQILDVNPELLYSGSMLMNGTFGVFGLCRAGSC